MSRKEKDGSTKKKGGALTVVVAVIAVCLIIGAAVYIIARIAEYKRGLDLYSEISDEFYGGAETHLKKAARQSENPDYDTLLKSLDPDGNPPAAKEYSEELEISKQRMAKLAEKYPHLFVWVSVTDAGVEYPVVKYKNNSYYLNRAPTGEYLVAGSVFADYRNSSNVLDNKNLVIYGHNLYSGGMFHPLTAYTKLDYFNSHREIVLYGFDGIYKYRVFSIRKVKASDEYIKTEFKSDDEFLAFAKRMKDKSMHKVDDVELTKDSRILTLSTCTNVVQTERYSIQAVLVEIIN